MASRIKKINKHTASRTKVKFADRILEEIQLAVSREEEEVNTYFRLMGWESLPEILKQEIRFDVQFMALEAEGKYSTCDQFVRRRRESVHFWVNSFLQEMCTLETALDALKIKPIAA